MPGARQDQKTAAKWIFIAIWAIVVALDLIAIAGTTRLTYNDGLDNIFASDNERFQQYLRFRDQFTRSESDVAILFQSPDFASSDYLERIEDFALEAHFIDGVAGSHSIFSIQGPTDASGTSAALIPAVLPDNFKRTALLTKVHNQASGMGRLISADHSLTAVIITLADPNSELTTVPEVLSGLRDLAAAVVEDRPIEIEITGLPALRAAVLDDLYSDLLILNLFGIVAGTLVCAIALRSIPLALLTAMPPGTALIWVMGVLGIFGFSINVLSVALPVLILVLSFADSLHLTFEVRRLHKSGVPDDQIVSLALKRVGPACTLASLTTAIAFAGLTISRSGLISELGLAGMVATLVALLAVIVAHPLLFTTVVRFAGLAALFKGNKGVPPGYFNWRMLSAAALSRPKTTVVVSTTVLVLAAAIHTTIKPNYSILENVSSDSSTIRALERLNGELVPVGSIDIPVRLSATTTGRLERADIDAISAVHRTAAAALPDAFILSLESLRPGNATSGTDEERAQIMAQMDAMSPSQKARFMSRDGAFGLVRVHVADNGAAANRETIVALENKLGADGHPTLNAAETPTGAMVMSAFVSQEMLRDLNLCFLAAVVMSGLLTIIWFRNLLYGLVALVPNVLPIVVVGAWLTLSGHGLEFSSGIALTIAFGLAVDDTVHILNRLRLNTENGDAFSPDAIRLSLEEVTPILVITTAVLATGLMGTFLSTIPAVRYFGVLSIVIFVLAIVADLLVLPAWLKVLHFAASRSGAR